MIFGSPGRFNNQFVKRSLRPRHICVILLFIYVILQSLVLATCSSPSTVNYYLTKLKYTRTANDDDAIGQLDLRLGYFGACLRTSMSDSTTSKSSSGNSWTCGNNAYTLLLSDPSFDSSNNVDVQLYNLVLDTGDLIRRRCLTPYVLLISVVLSFLIVCTFAFATPRNSPSLYKGLFFVSYISVSLSVIASIWQETNIKTANMLLSEVMNDYYSLEADYGPYARAAIWVGTGIQILISLCCLLLVVTQKFYPYFDPMNPSEI